DPLLLQLGDLAGKHCGGVDGRVDAVCLDGDDNVAADLEKVVCVQRNDAGLVGLGDVCENDVDHADQHAVALRVARVLDDGDDVCALLGDVDQVAARAMGELDCVDQTGGADDVRYVGDRGPRRSAEVEDLLAGRNVHVLDAVKDARGELAAERVPHAV